jgi:Uma2 family endonuclease
MRDFGAAHPATAELVVEVAVSSPALDRENAVLYAEAGVLEYWIVLARERQVEVYRRPEGGIYKDRQIVNKDGILQCGTMPSIRIRVSNLFT